MFDNDELKKVRGLGAIGECPLIRGIRTNMAQEGAHA